MAETQPEAERQGLTTPIEVESKPRVVNDEIITEHLVDPDPMFVPMTLALQAVFLILFAVGGEYLRQPVVEGNTFSLFQDIHGMLLVGLGFLVTYLCRYSFGGVAFNFLLCAVCIQWQLIMIGAIDQGWNGSPAGEHEGWGHKLRKYSFSINSLVEADMGTIAILISMGALLGRTNPSQLLLMALIEVPIYAVNFYIVMHYLKITDAGGSITIHVFGCYFGLAASVILGTPKNTINNKSMYHSELFAMIGTLFLWLYFPSLNAYNAYVSPTQASGHAALIREGDRTRAYVNTVLSLCASTMATFAFSKLNKAGKLDMAHIQNATLAGGVVMGACADLYVHPAGAVGIGFCAGALATFGYRAVHNRYTILGLYDTRGVNNLHGMPGILGAIASAIAIGSYSDEARFHRNMHYQAAYQIAGLCVTFGIAIVSGAITGILMKAIFPSPEFPYLDIENFVVPPEGPDFFHGTIRGRPVVGLAPAANV